MASSENHLNRDLLFFEEIKPHLPKPIQSLIKTCERNGLLKTGLLDRGNLVEQALAHASEGLMTVSSVNGSDFKNEQGETKGDSKSYTSTYYTKADGEVRHCVNITKVHNKVGVIRALVYDAFNEKFRYFAIWDYPRTKKTSCIKIHMDSNKSKYIDGTSGVELETFKDLACYTIDEDIEFFNQIAECEKETHPNLEADFFSNNVITN